MEEDRPDDHAQRRSPDVVAVACDGGCLTNLATGLADAGLHLDVVSSLEGLRDAFFRCGGPDALLLAPDLTPARALEAMRLMQKIDATLRIITFGDTLGRVLSPDVHVRRVSFHPDSRAAVGSVVQLLRSPPEH